jgi:DNA-binding SARP family transcriptional activator
MSSFLAAAPLVLAVAGSGAALHLFGGPRVVVGGRLMAVPEGSKRLLVFLALQRRHVERGWLAGLLWPDGEDSRAMGNLRSSLWRLRRAGVDILETGKWTIKLRDDIPTDIEAFDQWAARLIDRAPHEEDLKAPPCLLAALDFLPGWPEDWLIMERERVRHRALHALESLSWCLSDVGRFAEAVEAVTIAVCADPLRDSAQRALIDAHLAQGNVIEGRRSCDAYIATIRRELGIGPPPYLLALRLRIGNERTGSPQPTVATTPRR